MTLSDGVERDEGRYHLPPGRAFDDSSREVITFTCRTIRDVRKDVEQDCDKGLRTP